MTFKELFEDAMSKVDMTQKYEGRTEAIDAFIEQLRPLIQPFVDASKWDTVWVTNPYGKDDPYMRFCAHGTDVIIDFKVKLKKNGSHYHYCVGNVTMYLPTVAFTVDEELMTCDVAEVLDTLYDNDPKVAKKIKEEAYRAELIETYRALLTKYTEATNEFNELPKEVREQLRYAGLPRIDFF